MFLQFPTFATVSVQHESLQCEQFVKCPVHSHWARLGWFWCLPSTRPGKMSVCLVKAVIWGGRQMDSVLTTSQASIRSQLDNDDNVRPSFLTAWKCQQSVFNLSRELSILVKVFLIRRAVSLADGFWYQHSFISLAREVNVWGEKEPTPQWKSSWADVISTVLPDSAGLVKFKWCYYHFPYTNNQGHSHWWRNHSWVS